MKGFKLKCVILLITVSVTPGDVMSHRQKLMRSYRQEAELLYPWGSAVSWSQLGSATYSSTKRAFVPLKTPTKCQYL